MLDSDVRSVAGLSSARGGLVAIALCAIVSCSGGDSTSSTGTGENGGPAGGGYGDDGSGEVVTDGEIVARVGLRAPEEMKFLLRATVPVPPGIVRGTAGSDDEVALAVVDERNRTLTTQVNVVTRYPSAEDGASVVEVVAEVQRPRNSHPGDELTFDVAYHPHPAGRTLIGKMVRDMLAEPGALRLSTRDVFGNVYQADLFRKILTKDATARMLRQGTLMQEYAVHEQLLPVSPHGGEEATLPHLMGVHSYLTTYSRRNFFTLDLHVHNGMDGLDKSDPKDDALREIYFKDLRLSLPKGWKMATCFPSPTLGDQLEQGDRTVLPLIAERGDGKLHYMPQQARFVRRLVIFHQSAEDEALATLAHENLAFCRPGDSGTGNELWSWWNVDTARYFPQSHRLPELDFMSAANLQGQLEVRYAELREQVRTGAPDDHPLTSPALGWAHPWGSSYGGMTGGDEINLYDGIDTAWCGSREGYMTSMLTARCYIDRQPTALYNKSGRPTHAEDLLVSPATGEPYVDCLFFLTPTPGSDPWGFQSAPTYQTNAVKSQHLDPPYEADLSTWMPIDQQHYIRFTRNLKVLAWLGNDTLSKELLEQAAEVVRLSFHEFPNSSNGSAQVSGLRDKMNHVADFPGQGVDYHRQEGWSVDCAVAAYALGNDQTRHRYYPWFEKISQVVIDGQSTCSGNLMASYVGKAYNGEYYVHMTPHASFADNSIEGMRRQVFQRRDETRAKKLSKVIVGTSKAQISEGFWNEALGMPYFLVATGPVDQEGDFCTNIPDWGQSDNMDGISYFSSFAFAYETNGDEEYLHRAAQMLGGGDLLQRLKDQGMNNMQNHAALLAMLQRPPVE